MLKCDCGFPLLVKTIDPYPTNLTAFEKLGYERTCTAVCAECKKQYTNLKYD